jgi:DNA-binding transcriptional LysR family regulator
MRCLKKRCQSSLPPHHLLAKKHAITPYDLTGEALVLTAKGCTYRGIFESILTQAGVKPASIMGVSSNEVIKKFVCDGWGIGFLPRVVVEQELITNQLVEIPWAGPPFGIKAQLSYHKDKWQSPALNAFIEIILKAF